MDLADLNTQGMGFMGFLWRFIALSMLGVGLFFGL
jgi:hypothetical protein